MRFLEHGRVADTTRLREQFGYVPRWTSVQAFDDFVRARNLNRVLNPEVVGAAEAAVRNRLTPRRRLHA